MKHPGPRHGTADELGAHVSAAGGLHQAPGRSADVGAVAMQVFTKQPSRWAEPVLGDEHVAAFREAVARHRIIFVSAHDSYLINLASPDPALRQRSLDALREELRRAALLGITHVVTHPGNATDNDSASGIERNAEALGQALGDVPGVRVLLETTAGSGRALGATFEQLAAIMERVPDAVRPRVGVCFDTCHVWAAGHDLRRDYDGVMRRFDDCIGFQRIELFHLNDSVGDCGSRRDRHAGIGDGMLGDEPFRRLLLDDRFATVPKLLETPKGADHVAADRRNLARLRSFRA